MRASRDGATITGTIHSCRARLALPHGAVVRLRLEDATPAQAARDLIADAELPAEGRRTPLAFALPYDATRIDEARRYNVRAAILVGDDLLFTSTTAHPVITGGAPSRVDIDVQPVSLAPWAPETACALEETRWRATEICRMPAVAFEEGAPEITLHAEDARISGCGGGNRIVGFYELDGAALRLNVAAAKQPCAPGVLAQEEAFIEALSRATGYRLNGDRLDLVEDHLVVARFCAES